MSDTRARPSNHPAESEPEPAPEPALRDDGHWVDRPVFVTGATGLVGGALVERLLALGAEVVCLVRDDAPRSRLFREGLAARTAVVRGDVRDRDLLERALGEYEIRDVFHLAAQTIVGIANRNPVSTLETNVAGAWNVLEACRRSPLVEAVVLASSDKAYGDRGDEICTEETPLNGAHPYDVSKSCADLVAAAYARAFRSPVAITRCGNFYGPGDLNWNRIVPGTIRSVVRGERPVIRSDGSFVRDYFHVEDGADAYLLLARALAERPELRGQAFNFSNETPVSALDLVRRILRLAGADLEPDVRNRASNEIPKQRLSAAKARSVLGWTPRIDLDEGLRTTIAWYRDLLAGDRRGRPSIPESEIGSKP